ncbi:MAG TPA: hypothetical protein VIH90_05640 [Candidatus Saccharimonadales bacterium]
MDDEKISRARSDVEAALKSATAKLEADPLKQSENALKKAIKDSNEILVTATTIAPIHKSSLTLSRTKLYAEERSGLGKVSVMSVRAEDVLNINGEIGPVSGYITLSTKFTSPGNPYRIGPFHRKDVLNLKRVVQGYVIALQQKIDLSPIPGPELTELLYELGEDDYSIN